ncbi:lantibiotic dehydratase, partial [Streptomyces oryzae]|nr:lantibiotic dehydratase [Streptomyces oryzae]
MPRALPLDGFPAVSPYSPERTDQSVSLGSTALLRVAGVPVEQWCRAGSPELFRRADELADRRGRIAERARAASVRLGDEIVPDRRLTTADRRAALTLRRRLHSGDVPEDLPAVLPDPGILAAIDPDLVRELRELGDETAALRVSYGAFGREVAAERERTSLALLGLARTDPALGSLVEEAAPGAVRDLERRAAAGEPWCGKRQRKRVCYLWRALGRAAAKTTPRGWAGQLAVLPVRADAAGQQGGLLPEPGWGWALGEVAARRTENVHWLWLRLRDLDLSAAGPQMLLAPAPLRHTSGAPGAGELHVCVVDPRPDGGGRLRRLTLRRTPMLEAVLNFLEPAPRTLGALEASLAPPSSRPVLRAFLAHLHCLGVLQVCGVPEARRLHWTMQAPGPRIPLQGEAARGSFLDSYRKLEPAARTLSSPASVRGLPPQAAVRDVHAVAEGLALARRVAALCEADAGTDGKAAGQEGP